MAKLSIDDMKDTPEYKRLTVKQRLFVQTYICNGYEPVNATRTAHSCKNDKVAKVMSYAIMASPHVAAVLAMHFGDDPLEAFKHDLRRAIKKGGLTAEAIAGYRLLAEVQGFTSKRRPTQTPVPPQPPEKAYQLDEYESVKHG